MSSGGSDDLILPDDEGESEDGISSLPYYLELHLGSSGNWYTTNNVFFALDGQQKTLNKLTALDTPVSHHNEDLINTSTWSPSVAGLFLINYKATIGSGFLDRLIGANIQIVCETDGLGVIHENNMRNWGNSKNESDAKVQSVTLNLSVTVYATSGELFHFVFGGEAPGGAQIWMSTSTVKSNITITKIF